MNVTPLPRTSNRDPLIARLTKNGIGAELGVWKGRFSRLLLRGAVPAELHLIDPWAFSVDFPERWYGGAKAASQEDMDAICREVAETFAKNPRVKIHRLRSANAAPLFPDRYFDWVYIDGDHSYEAALEDLRLWYPKVKKGGILAGDDYPWRDESGQLAVARAVREFVATAGTSAPERLSSQFLIQL